MTVPTPPLPPDAADALVDAAATLRRSTVAVLTGARGRPPGRGDAPTGHGAGIAWTADGLVVTNAHVARDDRPTVVLPDDGARTEARLVARDPRRDLALLRVDAPLVPARRGEPATLRPGELLLALGHPLGVANALSVGILHDSSAPSERQPHAARAREPLAGVSHLVADLRLLPGNSGGPLADAAGRVVGVNAMVIGGRSVAISIDEIAHIEDSITPRPRLGASMRPVRVRRADLPDTVTLGLLVLVVAPAGAAGRAGLQAGDVLLGHAGRPLGGVADLARLLRDAGPGAALRLDVGRGGRRRVVTVALGDAVGEAVGDARARNRAA